MTPRESALAALSGRRPDGLVPHTELEFQLTAEYLGVEALRAHMLEGVTGLARDDMLKRNADLWIDVAQRLDWNIITGIHWLGFDDQCRTFELIREFSGEFIIALHLPFGAHESPVPVRGCFQRWPA